MRPLIPLAAVALMVLAAPAFAQTEATPAHAQSHDSTAMIRVERALTLSSVQSMSFVADPEQTLSPGNEPRTANASAVIQVTGDPGRSYKIRLPESIETSLANATIDDLTVWSETAGDVTQTLSGRLNDEGRDRLHISGNLRSPTPVAGAAPMTASVPLSVDYE